MKIVQKNGKRYRPHDLLRLIDFVARNKLEMSGEEAIKIIRAGEWKNRKNYPVWSWLAGLVYLLPEEREVPRKIQARA